MRISIPALLFCVTCVTAIAHGDDIDFRDEKTWPDLLKDRPVLISEDDEQLVTLMKKRHNASLSELRNRFTYWLQGQGTLESVCNSVDRFIASHRDLGVSPADDLQLQKGKLEFALAIQKQAGGILKSQNRTVNAIDEHFSRYYALHAEIELIQMRKDKKKDGSR